MLLTYISNNFVCGRGLANNKCKQKHMKSTDLSHIFKKWTTKISSFDPFKKTKAVTPLHKVLEVLSTCSNHKLKCGPYEYLL